MTTPKPADEMIKSLVNQWFTARKAAETKAQFEQELRDYIKSEKLTLLSRLAEQKIEVGHGELFSEHCVIPFSAIEAIRKELL
jgi:hypothetical protein